MNKKRFFASMLALVLLFSCVGLPSSASAEGTTAPPDGLVMSKTATASGNNYKIRLEAYTTGTVTTTTSTVPVDIVLVLDQSGSMAYDFNGDRTSNNTQRRQYAMKQAVNSFIDAVNEKYAADADHRMAIVTFGSDASTLQDWTYVDASGKTTLRDKINGLPTSPSGATNAGAGMNQAETLMGSGYNYTGINTTRQKVVVFFTDGVPTTQSTFNTTVANNAIASAKKMKDNGVTVYSIGIFKGANPNQLYGEKWSYWYYNDNSCNGNVGECWGGYNTDYETPAANRFMNYISTNFPAASEIGIELGDYDPANHGIKRSGFKITQNFDRTASSYYLTASDSASLNTIFQTISQNIQKADISLDSSTVVKDIISPYFTVPQNTSDIKIFTAAYQGSESWGPDMPSRLTPTFENGIVSVTGFDFNSNFVTEAPKEDGTQGSKLVIEVTVAPKEGFLGGNNVPTNGAESGIYDKDGNAVGLFDKPTVNVPIKDVTVTAEDKNVYLKSTVTADDLKNGTTIMVGDVELQLDQPNYGLETWQTEYVDLTVEIKDEEETPITGDLAGLTDDKTYTVTVTVSPKSAGTQAEGEPATAKEGEDTGKINVFKPELTFQDSTAYYGEEVRTDYSGNQVGAEKWKNGDNYSDSEGVKMLGKKPTLDITYTPDANMIKDGKYTKKDVPVKATVKIGTDDVTSHTTFVHDTCTVENCGWETPTNPGDPAFLIHIQTCTLNITKQGGAADESYVFDVFKDGKKYSEVTVWGNGTETIVELPVGTYTIQENRGWSWRYETPSYSDEVKLDAEHTTGTITCTNTKITDKWLNGFSQVVKNIFGVKH